MIVEKKLNKAFVYSFIALFQQRVLADEAFLNDANRSARAHPAAQPAYIERDTKLLVQIERRRLLVNILSPRWIHAFDAKSALGEIARIDDAVIFTLLHEDIVDTQCVLSSTRSYESIEQRRRRSTSDGM